MGPGGPFTNSCSCPRLSSILFSFSSGVLKAFIFTLCFHEHGDFLLLSSKVAGYQAASCRTQLCLGRILGMVQRWEVSTCSHICRPSVLPAVSWRFLLCCIRTTKLTCLCRQSPTLPTCPVLLPTRHPSVPIATGLWTLEKFSWGERCSRMFSGPTLC